MENQLLLTNQRYTFKFFSSTFLFPLQFFCSSFFVALYLFQWFINFFGSFFSVVPLRFADLIIFTIGSVSLFLVFFQNPKLIKFHPMSLIYPLSQRFFTAFFGDFLRYLSKAPTLEFKFIKRPIQLIVLFSKLLFSKLCLVTEE